MNIKDLISPFYAWKRALDKPYTVKKPLTEREGSDRYRGFHINDITKCVGCGTCESICQNEAIDLVEIAGMEPTKGDSALRPLVDYGRCCWCALCVDICPTGSLGMSNEYIWVSDDAEEFRFIPGVDEKPWNNAEKGYRRSDEAWLVAPERKHIPEVEPEKRKKTFDEFALGYTDEMAYEEAARCLNCGICVEACPTHMDIPAYIQSIRDNNLEEGLRILYDTNPLAESCGRICTAKCEDVCTVGINGEAIPIRWLKRYITDKTKDRKEEILAFDEVQPTGKKVAVIGGGPGGLSAAFYLARMGHSVTIYERHKKFGGMIKYGIPDYRLPEEALMREINTIIKQGVETKFDVEIGKDIQLEEIRKEYDAMFIAVGAQVGTAMPIEGLDNEGVYTGVDFLDAIANGERPYVGEKAIIVGGGNTAMDACRSAVRLGAEATVLYRRTEKEMPANVEEIKEAKDEGVIFEFLTMPTKIERVNNKLKVECIRMELGEPDDSGRRRPVPVQGSEFTMEVNSVVMAIGQKVNADFIGNLDIKISRWGTFEINPVTRETSVKGIYAGGDCETGPNDAIKAIAAGKEAAWHIDKYLGNK